MSIGHLQLILLPNKSEEASYFGLETPNEVSLNILYDYVNEVYKLLIPLLLAYVLLSLHELVDYKTCILVIVLRELSEHPDDLLPILLRHGVHVEQIGQLLF